MSQLTTPGVAVDRDPPPRQASHSRRDERRPSRPVDGPLPGLYLVLIAAVTLAGLLLRLPSFNDSLQGDEISTFYIVNGHSLARVLSLVYSPLESTPPLYFILAWATKGWLGGMAQSIRLVSLVTGTAVIPLTFLMGLWTVGRRAALVGATCVACSPYMIFFSTEARTYMLVLFLALLSSICLLRALDTNRPIWWVGYAVSTCAAVYSHYSVVFLLVAQFGWAFWAVPRARKALVLSNAAAVVGFLPWINGLRADFKAPNFITKLVPVNFHNISGILEHFWIGHPEMALRVMPGVLAVFLAAAGLALGVFGTVRGAWQRKQLGGKISPRVLMIVVLAVAPAALMIVYSWLRVDVLGGGNMIASWPALALAIGALVTTQPRALRVVAVTLIVTAYAIGGVQMLSRVSQRANAAAAMAFIDRTGKSGDPIVSAAIFSNPLSEVDAALAATASATYIPGNTEDLVRPLTAMDPHPVFRLSIPPFIAPPLNEQFHYLAGPNPEPVFWGLTAQSPQQVAHEAQSMARNGTVFLVTPFLAGQHPDSILKFFPQNPMSQFIKAMEPRFHIVQRMSYATRIAFFADFNSVNIGAESVFVFRDTPQGK